MQKLKLTKKYEKYSEYKDSGVEWLGKIPKGWKTISSKRIFSEIVKKGEINLPLASVTQDQGVVLRSESGLSVWNPESDISGYKTIKKGDFVISLRSFEGGIEFSDVTGLVSPAYTVLRQTKEFNSTYYKWLFKSNAFISSLQINVRGIRDGKNISFQDFSRIDLPMISELRDQEKIVNYLNQKTFAIDQIIKKKEKLIELLREKRTAVINHAVTKGLDPKIELTESGVEWVGKIPKNWKMRKIFHLFKTIGSGTTPDEKYLTDSEEGVPWVNTGDLTDYYMETPSKRVTADAVRDISTLKVFSKNSVVIAMYGATIGKLGIPKFDFCTNQACCVLQSPIHEVSEKFIYFWLLGNKKYVVELGVGGGQPNINKDIVKSLKISLPAINDQLEIVNYLELKLDNYNKSINQVEKSIELLQEFKSSLISNVVTGKVKI